MPKPISFNITVIQSLSKDVCVKTDSYELEDDLDGDLTISTKDTDWKEIYEDNYFTIPELLKKLEKEAKRRLMNHTNPKKVAYYQKIIDSCQNWCVDDYEVIE